MRALHTRTFILGSIAAFALGCDADAPTPPGLPKGELGTYHEPTAPESLIANLQVSYRNREINHYTELLAPEFIFRLQPIDASILGQEFLTRDQDSTGTRALLTTTEVSEIKINLIYSGRDITVNFPGTPVDSVKIRIITTDLQVDQTDGTTWVVTDQQEFYFRKGLAGSGENPNQWWMYEWDELPTLFATASNPTPVMSVTWGGLKTRYRSTSL
jgi:hypothetical protein